LENLGVAGKIILKLILKIAGKPVDLIQPFKNKGHWLARVKRKELLAYVRRRLMHV
jgi:hypothetical protein